MKKIVFDDGYREYAINGDETRVIRINPTDFGIVKRMKAAEEALAAMAIEHSEDGIEELDRVVREQLDSVFGEGTAQTVFGNVNCTSLAGGKTLYQNFLEAFSPIIKADIEAEKKKSDARVKKYTSQLT